MFLMCLDIAPKLEAAVLVIIKIKTHHKPPGAQGVRHAVMGRKDVVPEDAGIDHLFKYEGWKMLERDRMIHAAQSVGHAIMGRKYVEPEDAGIYHLFKHEDWKMLERDRMIHAARPFFKCVNEMFDFGDMLTQTLRPELALARGPCSASNLLSACIIWTRKP